MWRFRLCVLLIAVIAVIASGCGKKTPDYNEAPSKKDSFVHSVRLGTTVRYDLDGDGIGEDITVIDSKQSGAKGSAIYAATAAGIYPDVASAALKMGDGCAEFYIPSGEANEKYARLYGMYVELSETFVKSDIMKRLRNK
jgi:hypothetical protein